jgi:hypothetical protein
VDNDHDHRNQIRIINLGHAGPDNLVRKDAKHVLASRPGE